MGRSGGDAELAADAVGEVAHGRFPAPGAESGIELADVVQGPARLDAGEDVDGLPAGIRRLAP
ncbi:hypothetical protein GCM10010195_75250 [Kitasatospora griseola]|nr:hypothetical protein GCM10010195_75250 [Kitasatospora griseola]